MPAFDPFFGVACEYSQVRGDLAEQQALAVVLGQRVGRVGRFGMFACVSRIVWDAGSRRLFRRSCR